MGDGHDRRWLLTGMVRLAGAGVTLGLVPARAAAAQPRDRERLMRHAVEMRERAAAQGDQPYGAVVAKAGRVVGEGPSRVVTNGDPTAHAEVEAIRDACRRLGTRDLSGCELYASSRPCPMCETAAHWARVSRIYFGADLSDGGAPRYPAC